MRPSLYDLFFRLEDTHGWFTGMRKIRMAMLEGLLPENPSTLEIACGTGGFLRDLKNAGHVIYGCDISEKALGYCAERNLERLAAADMNSLPYRDEAFDFVSCNGGLYHESVKTEHGALGEMRRVCKTGGVVLVTDAACKALYGRHDRAFGGARRYSLGEMTALMEEAGFEILRRNYANAFMLPPVYAMKKLKSLLRAGAEVDILELPPAANRAVKAVLSLEARLVRRVRFPFGLEVMVAGRKK